MGEAKRRGTFEERKAQAIARNEKEREKRLIAQAVIEADKTPEQRQREAEAATFMCQSLGVLAGMGINTNRIFKS